MSRTMGGEALGDSSKGLLRNISKELLKSFRKDKQQIGVSQKRSTEEQELRSGGQRHHLLRFGHRHLMA